MGTSVAEGFKKSSVNEKYKQIYKHEQNSLQQEINCYHINVHPIIPYWRK